MKKLLLTLIAIGLTALGSVSCVKDPVPSIRTKTWSAEIGVPTKAKTTVIDMTWEPGDRVSVFSVRDGVITYRSDVEVTAKWKNEEAEKATITAEVDVNADSYYAYFPSTACPLQVGDVYSLTYDADDAWTDIPRLHDLPQYAEVGSTAKSINFEPLTSCFRMEQVRKSKLPITVKVFVEDENHQWVALYDGVISESTVDLDAHFTRKSLLHISDYYDFCWILPANHTYKVKFKVTGTHLTDPFTLERGEIVDINIWGKAW